MKHIGYYSDVKQATNADRTQLPKIVDAPRIADAELVSLVTKYLENGAQVGQSLGWSTDALEQSTQTPLGTLTDGEYVWPGDAAYYCRVYGIIPGGEEFLDLVKARDGACPILDAVALESAANTWYAENDIDAKQ